MQYFFTKVVKSLLSALTLCFALLCSSSQGADVKTTKLPKQVTLFVNSNDDFPFWLSEVDFAKAVASALSIELTVHFVPSKHRDRFGITQYIMRYLKGLDEKPNLIMSAFILGAEEELLSLMRDKSIPIISLNSHISDDQYKELGLPRERFPHWLGHLAPDDISAGNMLASQLIEKRRADKQCLPRKCSVNVFGFTGLPYAAVSKQRVQGLNKAVKQDGSSILYNAVNADWRRHIAFEKMEKVLSRHNDIDVFWAASDIMAWGIVDALKQYPYANQPIVGSMDWSPQTIEFIESGEIAVSLGGHFIEAGLALILYYDYIHGLDFAEQYGTSIMTHMTSLTRQNVATLGPFLKKPEWNNKVISQYSKFNNGKRKSYQMDPQRIITDQLN